MHFPYGFTVTVTHYTENTDGDWIASGSEQVSGCAVSLSSKRTYETETYSQDTIRADLTLFMPTGSNIQYTDRITLNDGTTWDVWGYAIDFSSPFSGWAPGMQVPLRRYQG